MVELEHALLKKMIRELQGLRRREKLFQIETQSVTLLQATGSTTEAH